MDASDATSCDFCTKRRSRTPSPPHPSVRGAMICDVRGSPSALSRDSRRRGSCGAAAASDRPAALAPAAASDQRAAQPTDHQHPDHRPPDHRPPDHQPPDHQHPDHRHPDHQHPDHQHPDHRPMVVRRSQPMCSRLVLQSRPMRLRSVCRTARQLRACPRAVLTRGSLDRCSPRATLAPRARRAADRGAARRHRRHTRRPHQ